MLFYDELFQGGAMLGSYCTFLSSTFVIIADVCPDPKLYKQNVLKLWSKIHRMAKGLWTSITPI